MAGLRGINFKIPGVGVRRLSELVLDFNGTLALEGRLLPGVRPRLVKLSKRLVISVLTADTYGTASKVLKSIPVRVQVIRTGVDKKRFARSRRGIAAIGNGRNDVGMVRAALIGIAVMGPEGCSGELLRVADLVTGDIQTALDMLLNPQRLTATLRT
ncbi:MAG: HAD family hydrolase [bacterium]